MTRSTSMLVVLTLLSVAAQHQSVDASRHQPRLVAMTSSSNSSNNTLGSMMTTMTNKVGGMNTMLTVMIPMSMTTMDCFSNSVKCITPDPTLLDISDIVANGLNSAVNPNGANCSCCLTVALQSTQVNYTYTNDKMSACVNYATTLMTNNMTKIFQDIMAGAMLGMAMNTNCTMCMNMYPDNTSMATPCVKNCVDSYAKPMDTAYALLQADLQLLQTLCQTTSAILAACLLPLKKQIVNLIMCIIETAIECYKRKIYESHM